MLCCLIWQFATAGRLTASGLLRTYPGFSLWSLAVGVNSGVLLYVARGHGFSSPEYVSAWQPLESLSAACLLFVGWEAYQLTARNYPSLGNHGRNTLLIAACLGFALSLLPFAIEGRGYFWNKPTWVIAVLTRTATLTVGVGMIIAIPRLRFVPIPEQKNLKNHRRLIVLYCAGQAISLGMLVITHDNRWLTACIAAKAICWLIWPFAMTAAGEQLNRRTYSAAEKAEMRMQMVELKRWLGQAVASLPTRRDAVQR